MFRGLHLIKAYRALMRTSCCDVMINVTLELFRGEHPLGVPEFDARLAVLARDGQEPPELWGGLEQRPPALPALTAQNRHHQKIIDAAYAVPVA